MVNEKMLISGNKAAANACSMLLVQNPIAGFQCPSSAVGNMDTSEISEMD